jgi:hypothetical protein
MMLLLYLGWRVRKQHCRDIPHWSLYPGCWLLCCRAELVVNVSGSVRFLSWGRLYTPRGRRDRKGSARKGWQMQHLTIPIMCIQLQYRMISVLYVGNICVYTKILTLLLPGCMLSILGDELASQASLSAEGRARVCYAVKHFGLGGLTR